MRCGSLTFGASYEIGCTPTGSIPNRRQALSPRGVRELHGVDRPNFVAQPQRRKGRRGIVDMAMGAVGLVEGRSPFIPESLESKLASEADQLSADPLILLSHKAALATSQRTPSQVDR